MAELLDSLYLNTIFYGLTILIAALIQTIPPPQLDLYHAISVTQLILSLPLLHGFGIRRYISSKKNQFQNEDEHRHSDIISLLLSSLIVLRVVQPFAIRRPARVQRPRQIRPCFLHLSGDRSLGAVPVYDNPRHDHIDLLCNLTVVHHVRKAHQGDWGRQSRAGPDVEKREETATKNELGEEYVEEVKPTIDRCSVGPICALRFFGTFVSRY